MTISSLSSAAKDQFLQSLRACAWFMPRQPSGAVSVLASFSLQDFESAVHEVIEQHRAVTEDSDIPDDREIVLELADYLEGRDLSEVLPQLLGVVQGRPPFDDLLMLVKSLSDEGLCSDCVAEQVYRAYIARRLKSERMRHPVVQLAGAG